MPVDKQLRREHAAAVLADGDMNVRGAEDADERVIDRLDRAEVVLALRVAEEASVSLKVAVETGWLAAARVHVRAGPVDLPDLHESIPHRLTRFRQHAAGQVRDLADGRSDAVIDDEEVVVGVERELVRIERPFGR